MTFDPGQIPSLLRQGAQHAAGAVTVLVVLGSIDADTAKSVVGAINDVVAGLSQATAGISKIAVILGPLVGGLIARFAFLRSSSKAKIADVEVIASDPTQPAAPEAKAALKAATASLPNTLVVEPAHGIETIVLAAKTASMPEVKTVFATPEIAALTVSNKVIAP